MDQSNGSGIRSAPKSPFNYEARVKAALRANQLAIVDKFDSSTVESLKSLDPQLYKRLETYSKNVNHSIEEVHALASERPLFAKHFAIDPKKQNIYEDIAYERIKDIPGVSNIRRPAAGGRESIVIEKLTRKVLKRSEVPAKSPTTKSVDFIWETNGIIWFASHKYTLEGGGAQDNQFKDLCTYLEYAPDKAPRINPDSYVYDEDKGLPAYFVALADGPYYMKKGTNGSTRLNELKHYANGITKFACPIDYLSDIMLITSKISIN